MLPWFLMCLQTVLVKEANSRINEKGVAIRVSEERFGLNQVLFADDVVMVADLEESLYGSMLSLAGER